VGRRRKMTKECSRTFSLHIPLLIRGLWLRLRRVGVGMGMRKIVVRRRVVVRKGLWTIGRRERVGIVLRRRVEEGGSMREGVGVVRGRKGVSSRRGTMARSGGRRRRRIRLVRIEVRIFKGSRESISVVAAGVYRLSVAMSMVRVAMRRVTMRREVG
jgi:hypothetical protein